MHSYALLHRCRACDIPDAIRPYGPARESSRAKPSSRSSTAARTPVSRSPRGLAARCCFARARNDAAYKRPRQLSDRLADFERRQGGALQRAVAIAIAADARRDHSLHQQSPIIRPALIGEKLNVDRYTLVIDFEAVGHAVAQADAGYFERLTGPDEPLPAKGTVSVIGPGTGLGVAHVWRDGTDYRVQVIEGGHVDFAPLDSIEDAILARLRNAIAACR